MSDCIESHLYIDKDGYGRKKVYKEGKASCTPHHRFAYAERHNLDLFGEEMDGMEVDHLCRNRSCINADHLELVTHADNVRRGSRTKLDEYSVRWIRSLHQTGHYSYRDLVTMFGMSQTAIACVVTRKSWAHVA